MVSKHYGITGEDKMSELLLICGVGCEKNKKKITKILSLKDSQYP